MRRVSSLFALSLVTAAVGCSPVFNVDFDWTIDGAEPAAVCSALPEGAAVAFTILSRDAADPRSTGPITETTASAQCGDGTATIQTGPFADVLIAVTDGDVTLGSAAAVAVAPGSASRGFVEGNDRARADITLLQGSITANFTIAGQRCDDAGASSFTVTLLEQTEPNTLVAVDGAIDVTVPCTGGDAVFTHTPVNVGSPYRVKATTTVDGTAFGTVTAGEGVVTSGAATFFTVDLQSL